MAARAAACAGTRACGLPRALRSPAGERRRGAGGRPKAGRPRTAAAARALVDAPGRDRLGGNRLRRHGVRCGGGLDAAARQPAIRLQPGRRDECAAARGALSAAALTYINNYTRGVRTAYVRLLASVGSEAFVLVPVEERDATDATGGVPSQSAALQNALCLYLSDSSPVFTHVGCWSLAEVADGRAKATFNGQLFGLAPDGVSAVTLSSPTSPSLSASVSGNFFTLTLPPDVPPPLGYSLSFTRDDS